MNISKEEALACVMCKIAEAKAMLAEADRAENLPPLEAIEDAKIALVEAYNMMKYAEEEAGNGEE